MYCLSSTASTTVRTAWMSIKASELTADTIGSMLSITGPDGSVWMQRCFLRCRTSPPLVAYTSSDYFSYGREMPTSFCGCSRLDLSLTASELSVADSEWARTVSFTLLSSIPAVGGCRSCPMVTYCSPPSSFF